MQRLEGQRLREFLHPFQSALTSAHSNTKAILHPGGSLSYPETSAGTIVKPEESPGKVMNDASWHDRPNLCGNFFHFQAGDKTGKVMCMRSDVAYNAAWTT